MSGLGPRNVPSLSVKSHVRIGSSVEVGKDSDPAIATWGFLQQLSSRGVEGSRRAHSDESYDDRSTQPQWR